MKSYNLKDLFFTYSKERRIRLKNPLLYEDFKEILCATVSNINLSASVDFFKEKYEIYCIKFQDKPILKTLGFFENSRHIQYFLSRGWPYDKATKLLKDKQTTVSLNSFIKKYGEIVGKQKYQICIQKHKETHKVNFLKGKHKIFLRPSQIEYWEEKGFNKIEAKEKCSSYYSKLGKEQYEKRRLNGEEFLTIRQLKFWLKRGFSLEDAHKELSLRYGTRSLDYCIEKYGKYEGVIKFNERNKKWIDTLNTKSDEEKLEILKRKTRNLKRYSKKSINFARISTNN